jgi:hypothetical protein
MPVNQALHVEHDPAGLETATTEGVRSLEGDVVGFSVLGVGAGTAKLTIDPGTLARPAAGFRGVRIALHAPARSRGTCTRGAGAAVMADLRAELSSAQSIAGGAEP